MPRSPTATVLALLLGVTTSLPAQVPGPVPAKLTYGIRGDTSVARSPQGRVGMGRLIAGGVVGAGIAIGASQLAYQVGGGARVCGDDPCGMIPGLVTLALLEPILIPVGVHLANHRRGSFAGTFFASVVSGAAIMYVGSSIHIGDGMLLVAPMVQVVATSLIERASENNRRR